MKTLLCCFVCLLLLGCNGGDQGVSEVEKTIQQQFETEGFTVTEIKLSKRSNEELYGYVRLKKTVPGVGEMDFSKLCSATRQENASQYSWRCENQ